MLPLGLNRSLWANRGSSRRVVLEPFFLVETAVYVWRVQDSKVADCPNSEQYLQVSWSSILPRGSRPFQSSNTSNSRGQRDRTGLFYLCQLSRSLFCILSSYLPEANHFETYPMAADGEKNKRCAGQPRLPLDFRRACS